MSTTMPVYHASWVLVYHYMYIPFFPLHRVVCRDVNVFVNCYCLQWHLPIYICHGTWCYAAQTSKYSESNKTLLLKYPSVPATIPSITKNMFCRSLICGNLTHDTKPNYMWEAYSYRVKRPCITARSKYHSEIFRNIYLHISTWFNSSHQYIITSLASNILHPSSKHVASICA